MRIVFMGTPEFAVPCLERLVSDGHEVVLAVTQADGEIRFQSLTTTYQADMNQLLQ